MKAGQGSKSTPEIAQPPGRTAWAAEEIRKIHDLPFPDLLYRAQMVHRAHHDPGTVQLCTLLSIKTGGCAEDCKYCPQSGRYETGLDSGRLLDVPAVLEAARQARQSGSTRFCMGAAWRSPPDGPQFQRILEMVRGVRQLGMEACCTLGMLTDRQAAELAQAGLTAYNHNLDTGPAYYQEIISTRSYQERLDTLKRVRKAGITVCCGGIIGMGEDLDDRMELLAVLAGLAPPPESVPINALVRVPGTPLADQPPLDPLEMVRMVATARIVLPVSRVRLSAGRTEMSDETQALCFLAGANSIFTGVKLLTTENPGESHDQLLLKKLGLSPALA
ncbi:MAG: biotin synthase BioB [Acidobacteriota bacterium]